MNIFVINEKYYEYTYLQNIQYKISCVAILIIQYFLNMNLFLINVSYTLFSYDNIHYALR